MSEETKPEVKPKLFIKLLYLGVREGRETPRGHEWAEVEGTRRSTSNSSRHRRVSEEIMNNKKPLFELGQVVATPACLEALQASGQDASQFLQRHVTGDFGDLCDEDRHLNEQAVVNGDRILSAYILADNAKAKIWIISEAKGDDGKRASTCLLLPSDY